MTTVVLNGDPEYQGSASTGVFSGCDQLQTVTIANGLTQLGDGMFAHCTKLSAVVLPDTLTRIGESDQRLPDKSVRDGKDLSARFTESLPDHRNRG